LTGSQRAFLFAKYGAHMQSMDGSSSANMGSPPRKTIEFTKAEIALKKCNEKQRRWIIESFCFDFGPASRPAPATNPEGQGARRSRTSMSNHKMGATGELHATGELRATENLGATGELRATGNLGATGELRATGNLGATGELRATGELDNWGGQSRSLSAAPGHAPLSRQMSRQSVRSFVASTSQHFDLGTSFTPHYNHGSAPQYATAVSRTGFARNSNGNYYTNFSRAPSLTKKFVEMNEKGFDFSGQTKRLKVPLGAPPRGPRSRQDDVVYPPALFEHPRLPSPVKKPLSPRPAPMEPMGDADMSLSEYTQVSRHGYHRTPVGGYYCPTGKDCM